MSSRIFTKHVHLFRDAVPVSFAPGDAVPEWATVTNPAVFTEATPEGVHSADTPAQSTAPTIAAAAAPAVDPAVEPAGDDLDGLSLPDLKTLAATLGLAKTGNKDTLKSSIRAARATAAPAAEDDDVRGRAALEATLRERGIEFEDTNSDEELEALIEGA